MNIFSIYVRSPVCVRSVRESARGARLTHVCIRGVKGAISTALTSVVGYADPHGGGTIEPKARRVRREGARHAA